MVLQKLDLDMDIERESTARIRRVRHVICGCFLGVGGYVQRQIAPENWTWIADFVQV